MLIVKSKVAKIIKDSNKRMSKDAWTALDSRIISLIQGAIKLTGSFSTITDTEILMSGRAKQ